MSFDPDKPYNDVPFRPSKAELETSAVLRKTIAANKAFAELKSASELIPKLLDLLPGRKGDMSKNPEFLDTFLECVQAANIFLSVFIWL
jgi:hypothetical protein